MNTVGMRRRPVYGAYINARLKQMQTSIWRVSGSDVRKLNELRAMFDHGEKKIPAANAVLEALGPVKQGCDGVLGTIEQDLKKKIADARTDKTSSGKQIGLLNKLYAWGSATLIGSFVAASSVYFPSLLTKAQNSWSIGLGVVAWMLAVSVAAGFSAYLFLRIKSEKKTLEGKLKEIKPVRSEIEQALNDIHVSLALPTIV